nr:hypothetical protein [Tanacetum cinerariifolium]
MVQDNNEEIKAENKVLNDGIGETKVETDKGVFGNIDKEVFGNEVNELHSDTNGDENAKMVTANDSQSIFHDHTDTSKQFDNTNAKNVGDKDNSSDKSDSSTNVGRKLSDSFNHEIGMQLVKRRKLPIWVRMTEVAPEAWSVDGISALASSLGNPLIMDTMTANMCHSGLGRLNFARVLIEMKADKEDKKVNVSYDWKPLACSHCQVFGQHSHGCKKRPRTSEEKEVEKKKDKERRNRQSSMVNNTSEYYARRWNEEVRHEKSKENSRLSWNIENRKQEYRKKQVVEKVAEKGKNTSNKEESKGKYELNNKEFKAMKKTANKYSILETLPDDDPVELNILKERMVVDQNKEVKKKMRLEIKDGWKKIFLSDSEEENVIANEIDGRGSNLVNSS